MRARVWQTLDSGWRWFWRRVNANFLMGLLVLTLASVMLWALSIIDGDLSRVLLTAASVAFPIMLLVGPERPLSERLKPDWGILGTALFV